MIRRLPPVISPEAGAVPFEKVTLKLWGDDESGRVNDWVYVSNEMIQQLVFSIPPGGRFLHSDRKRTIFGATELYYVVSGTLILANPQTGEVHRVEEGQAAYFRRGTWHHGFSYGSGELRVLEFFAPPPATGSTNRELFASSKPLETPTYVQDQWLERWPMTRGEAESSFTQRVIAPEDILWRLEGNSKHGLVGIYLSTAELTVGYLELLPGQMTDPQVHGGDEAGYVLDGRLNLFLPEDVEKGRGNGWFQMERADGFYVPSGTPHQYCNMTDRPVRSMFGVAPRYLPNP